MCHAVVPRDSGYMKPTQKPSEPPQQGWEQVTPSIDENYPLADVPEAVRRFVEARHHGKIVISVTIPNR